MGDIVEAMPKQQGILSIQFEMQHHEQARLQCAFFV